MIRSPYDPLDETLIPLLVHARYFTDIAPVQFSEIFTRPSPDPAKCRCSSERTDLLVRMQEDMRMSIHESRTDDFPSQIDIRLLDFRWEWFGTVDDSCD